MKKNKIDSIIDGLMFLYILSLYILTYREGLNTISNLLALMLVATIWVNSLINGRKIAGNKLLIIHAVFIFICLFTALYAIDQATTLSKVRTLFLIFIVMFSLINYVDSFEKLKKVMAYFIYSGLIASVYIIINSDFTELMRFGGELGNVNAIGMSIAIATVFCFYIILNEKKYWYSFFLLVMIPCILLTGSRKALLFFIINTILIAYFRNRKSFSKILKFIFISTCVLLISYYFVFNIPLFYEIIGERMENMFSFLTGEGTDEASLNIRYSMAQVGMELFKNKPIMGYGIDNYRFLYAGTYSHNNFIELMVGTGIFGVFIYYLAHLLVIKDLFHISKSKKLETLCFTFITIILSYIVLSPSLVYYDSKHFSILLVLASVICRITEPVSEPVVISGYENKV